MKNKNITFKLGKSQLQKIKDICACIEEINRVVYDDMLSDQMKVESIKMFLERFAGANNG